MKRIEESYITRALGFPIVIRNVELRHFMGDWVPEIDWTALMHTALWALAHKPVPLTGNEVKFVRTYMEKTLQEFASTCEVQAHQTVMRWEESGDEFTGMNRATEILLRARILEVVPQYIWEHFESKRKKPRLALTKALKDVSSFEKRPSDSLSFFPESSNSNKLQYAYK